jgi:hypothetical protein
MANNVISTDGYDNLEEYVVSSEGIIYVNDGDEENITVSKAVGFLDLNRKVVRQLNEEEKTLIMPNCSYVPDLQPKQHIKPAVNSFGFSQPSRPSILPGLQPPSFSHHN